MSTAPPMWASGGVQNPITQSGRVVLNATKDEYSIHRRRTAIRNHIPGENLSPSDKIVWGSGADVDDDYSVLVHEIAVHDSNRQFEHRMARHESVPVVTSANGFTADCYDLYQPAGKNSLTFMGIAGTRARHNEVDAIANESDCVVQIGGLCTIINNGPFQIPVGEWVCWDFPVPDEHARGDDELPKQQGVSSSKKQFIVRGYNAFMSSVLNIQNAYKKSYDSSRLGKMQETPVEKSYAMEMFNVQENCLQAQSRMMQIQGRIFGKAMNTAQPGQQLDILLGAHCM